MNSLTLTMRTGDVDSVVGGGVGASLDAPVTAGRLRLLDLIRPADKIRIAAKQNGNLASITTLDFC
jgi:hypothetical protein